MPLLLNVLYLLVLLCVSPWLLWRFWRHGRYREGWSNKLRGLSRVPSSEKPFVWLHSVSVGEVQVLRPIVEQLEKHRPDLQLAISASTDSGIELARKLYGKHFVFYTPFDLSWAIRSTLQTLRPKLIVLAELELWPNWLLSAERAHCPVAIINGRLSESSFQGYARIPYLVRKCMRTIDWLGAQSDTYAKRFEALGVSPSRIIVTGNVKFDGAIGDRLHSEVQIRRQFLELDKSDLVWVAGSTQAPEEELVLRTFIELSHRFPKLRLVLVPRHPERFDEVAQWIEVTGLPWARRSLSPRTISDPNWKIFLGDTIGELRWWWGVAELGFVGGSFGDRGGQNMIEPCAYGVATCFGPNTKNFADIVKILSEAHACEQLHNPDALKIWVESMLLDPEKRAEMSRRAQSTCEQHRGASLRTWEQIERLLDARSQAVG
jgi:3-deoxy-D-manno-octulosonic-acid transferase